MLKRVLSCGFAFAENGNQCTKSLRQSSSCNIANAERNPYNTDLVAHGFCYYMFLKNRVFTRFRPLEPSASGTNGGIFDMRLRSQCRCADSDQVEANQKSPPAVLLARVVLLEVRDRGRAMSFNTQAPETNCCGKKQSHQQQVIAPRAHYSHSSPTASQIRLPAQSFPHACAGLR